MARLPERPNFEHLKKQAKDLLRLYEAKDATAFTRFRESLPAASGKDDAAIIAMGLALHDAQSCIAREYNLPSWEALRNHVDWRNSRLSKARIDVVPLWLHMVYGHQEDRPEPLLAARAYDEEPELLQGELFLACAVGDEEAVRRAIAADPSCANETGSQWRCPGCREMLDMPPLVAVTHSSLLTLPRYRDGLRRCGRLLLDNGAGPNQSWNHGEHPLSALYGAAGKNFDPELTRMLLDAGAEPNDGESLYHSIDAPDHACTRMLLEAGARPELANAVAKQLDHDDVERLRLILKYAKGVEDRELIWAIRRGRSAEHIALLLAAGANPQAMTKDGLSAYRYALQCGLRDVAKLLEKDGAGEPLSIEERFVAACAAVDDHEARQMLAAHPGIIGQLSETQLQQLPELTEAGNHRAVRLMVELGWPIAVRGGDWTASSLNLAVFQGNQALARFLMERGASWSEVHGFGGNVCGTLAWASRNKPDNDSIGCAQVLLDHGVPPARREQLLFGGTGRFPGGGTSQEGCMIEQSVRMRIGVVRPPAGVRFCLQRGKENLEGTTATEGWDLHFDFEVRARPDACGSVRLFGTFVQGPPTARFLYVCVGTCAGQLGSPWTRRVKVPLTGITWKQVEAAKGGLLDAAYEGAAKDGSPACATVKLIKPWSPA